MKTLTNQEQTIEQWCGLLAENLPKKAWLMATAESCTGGLIAGACTDLAGSSGWFERGFITYSNEAKTELLGVPPELFLSHGAVSEAVVRAMAQGALRHSRAQVAVAVTGVAGPSGGSPDKPVGTVWFGWALGEHVDAECRRFDGDRAAVRQATVRHALAGLAQRVLADPTPAGDLVHLKGLGPRSSAVLAHAGIHTRAQLQAADPYRLYLQLRASRPGVSLNLLYALIGAQENVDWRLVARERKTAILMRLDDLQRA